MNYYKRSNDDNHAPASLGCRSDSSSCSGALMRPFHALIVSVPKQFNC